MVGAQAQWKYKMVSNCNRNIDFVLAHILYLLLKLYNDPILVFMIIDCS
jgi:hypothetical protein